VSEESKAEAAFSYFNEVLGKPPLHSNMISLELLDLPRLDLAGMGERFIEEEIWSNI
jgi:hypothetical protein